MLQYTSGKQYAVSRAPYGRCVAASVVGLKTRLVWKNKEKIGILIILSVTSLKERPILIQHAWNVLSVPTALVYQLSDHGKSSLTAQKGGKTVASKNTRYPATCNLQVPPKALQDIFAGSWLCINLWASGNLSFSSVVPAGVASLRHSPPLILLWFPHKPTIETEKKNVGKAKSQ